MFPDLRRVDAGRAHIYAGADYVGVGVGTGVGVSGRVGMTLLSAQYLVNQWLDSYQIFMDI